jgi:transposase
MSDGMLSAPTKRPRLRAPQRREAKPRFKPDQGMQVDFVFGCPELALPADHLARGVAKIIAEFDLSQIEAGYSSLGRYGYRPSHMLGIWVYASLIGIHEGSVVARRIKTDLAFRYLSGNYTPSSQSLNRFRHQHGPALQDLIEQSVRLAEREGLVDPKEVAVDSVRLRAHASMSKVRSVTRLTKRLAELRTVLAGDLSAEQRITLEKKLVEYEAILARCAAEGRQSLVLTNPSAGLIHFPHGGSQAGHRVTVAAVGASERLVLSVLIDSDNSDAGKLEAAMTEARRVLIKAGCPEDVQLQGAADAGYFNSTDLAFAARSKSWADILIPEASLAKARDKDGNRFFDRDAFHFRPDGKAICPSGREMKGPYRDGKGALKFIGVGCEQCPLKPKCTDKKQRQLAINSSRDQLREGMRERMAQPDAKARYKRRMATIEPVFSNLEDRMSFHTLSSRDTKTIRAEIMLKLLAHNISRLLSARRLLCVHILLVANS